MEMVTVRKDVITEERRAAHNASSRRSYAKNRSIINQRRRDMYQKNKAQKHRSSLEPLIRRAVRVTEIEVNSGRSHEERCSPLAEVIDRLDRISAKFSILTQHNIRGYANSVYHEYLQTITLNQPKGQRSLIEDAILPISALEQDILGYEHVILNSAGVGWQMCYLQKALRPIRELVGWLEEMLCEAMISPKGLRDKYDRGDLAFLTL
ncbi:hypothetical protein EDD18DRAFT_1366584 [Armillaria luteobubalina]|uniref:Uncharacterized protein n=1 Tax=Armillaria luteobubalina TaxID=153913 RepID=A0AA39P2D0_9AGAR|nr:hypothetical protein EDD18DRAFT_1366584 [Armillaria luteobubalina]